MTQSLASGDVGLDLGDGVFTLHWRGADVTVGPCTPSVSFAGSELGTRGPGTWDVSTGGGYGRHGTWARWQPARDGPRASVHLPAAGPVVVVDVEASPRSAVTVDRLTPVNAVTTLEYARRLVDGYESWSYSGIRGPEPGQSFWNSAYVAPDGRALGIQALDGRRWCTRVSNAGPRLRVDCGATPTLVKEPGTWGYRVGEALSMRLPVDAHETVRSSPVAVAASRGAIELVEELAALAAATMDTREWSGPAVRGWESWYEYGLFVSADDVLANALTLREHFAARPGFDLVQIDDGWQRTYGAWWPNERFPDDLGELVTQLRDLGCRAGLWLAPFRVQPGGPGVATDHRDWCVRGDDGAPLLDERHGAWALDATNPDALDWVRALGTQVRSWGFDMVKVDFCYLGAFEGRRHDAKSSGIEALRRGFAALVEGLGDRMYVLGCGMPILPAVGLCHANRTGHDLAMPRAHQSLGHPLDDGWTGFAGVRAGARNLAARWAHAGRWYDVDPDVVMVWGSDGLDPAGYSIEEARVLATMAAISGGPYLLADDLAALVPLERALLQTPGLLDLVANGPFRPIDVFDRHDSADVPEHAYSSGAGPRQWNADRGERRVLALFNWDDTATTLPVPPDLRGVIELWTGVPVGRRIDVPPRAVRVLSR